MPAPLHVRTGCWPTGRPHEKRQPARVGVAGSAGPAMPAADNYAALTERRRVTPSRPKPRPMMAKLAGSGMTAWAARATGASV